MQGRLDTRVGAPRVSYGACEGRQTDRRTRGNANPACGAPFLAVPGCVSRFVCLQAPVCRSLCVFKAKRPVS